MRTKQNGVPKAFEPYKQEEIRLILAMVPTHSNVRNLARSLGRTPEAIYTIFNIAYSGKWLKKMLKDMDESQQNVVTKIAKAKKRYGICIGYESD